MSPTQRSLAVIKKKADMYQIVEHWNAFSHKRVDLFGFLDLVFLEGGKTYGVQITSGSHHAERVKKICHDNAKKLEYLKGAGWVVLCHSWSKKKDPKGKRLIWTLREQIL